MAPRRQRPFTKETLTLDLLRVIRGGSRESVSNPRPARDPARSKLPREAQAVAIPAAIPRVQKQLPGELLILPAPVEPVFAQKIAVRLGELVGVAAQDMCLG